MAQFYEAKEVSEKLEEQLEICKWEKINDGQYFEIELPVVLYFNYQRLCLRIYPVDDGYYISDDGQTFIEYSGETKYYYDLFNQRDIHYHYEILLENNYLYKKYSYDFSLIAAIDEFIKFFVYLEEFMSDSNIV